MKVLRCALALGVVAAGFAAVPASAQFFLQSRDFRGEPVRGDEAGLGEALPDLTEAERRAVLVWNLRAGLNVAALQCQFEPTLLTVNNYNAMVKRDHTVELQNAFDTVGKYFVRVKKNAKVGQSAFDAYNTRLYSGFAPVAAQFGFCQTANAVGREAIFAPRGELYKVAETRMRELRNSLVPYGEQRFARYIGHDRSTLPRLDAICWNKKAEWQERKCGAQNFPPAGVGVATR